MNQQGLRILLAIKDADLRKSIAWFLGDCSPSYEVEIAESFGEAWDKVVQFDRPYNVLLIDEALGDGQEPQVIELATRIQSLSPQVEPVILTGSDGEPARAFRCLRKPVDLDKLRVVIGQAAEHQRLRATAFEKQLLERMLENSATLLAIRDRKVLFASILEGVRAIGFDRVRLYLPSGDRKHLVVGGHCGMREQYAEAEWPVDGDPHLALLMSEPYPRVFSREEAEPFLEEEPVAVGSLDRCVYAPLFLRSKFFGLLAADNGVSGGRISDEQLGPVALFASLSVAAIENARTFERAENRAKALDAALRVSTTINSSLHLSHILNVTCEAAVKLFNVSHSGLVLFNTDLSTGRVVAEYPELSTRGLEIPLAGVPAEDELLRTREPIVIDDLEQDTRLGQVGEAMCWQGIRSTLIVPVVSKDKLIGSFGLDTIGNPRAFTNEEIELCKLFAAQVAGAIENARLFENIKSQTERLEALRKTSLAITSENKPDAILLAIINQAVGLLQAYSGGIYKYNEQMRELKIIADNKRPNKVGKMLPVGKGMARSLVESGKPYLKVPDWEESEYKVDIFDDEGPFGAVLQVPLIWKEKIIGVLYIEDRKGREFTEEEADLLRLFADQAAIALENAELIATEEETARREAIKRNWLLKASNIVASAGNLTEGLSSLAEMIAKFLRHTFCRILLLDQTGHYLVVRAAYPTPRTGGGLDWKPGLDQFIALSDWPDLRLTLEKYPYKVVRWGKKSDRRVLEVLSKELGMDKTLQSLMVIPMKANNKLVGMLEVGEMRSEERTRFTPVNVELAKNIAERATLLIDRLRFYEFSQRLQQSSQKMSEALTITEVLQTIAQESRDILRGTSSTIWPYDQGFDRFLPDGLVTEGIPDEFLEAFRKIDPAPGGITYAVKEKGWLPVPDVGKSKESFLVGKRREILNKMGVKSFQGHSLKVGQETLAVLYVNYDHSIQLSEENRRLMKDLADRAAQALKRVQLLDQINKARMMASIIASATASGGLRATLYQIAQETKRTVECDVVTLYVYNPLTGKCDHPSTMVGVLNEERASQFEAKPDSIIYKMLDRDNPYIVENIEDDKDFKPSRFAREEGIESLIAVPLKWANQKVGVMFVSYRTPHRFSVDERANIDVLAAQAAIAILFEVLHQRLGVQEELQKFSRKLLKASGRQEILDCAVATARNLLKTHCANIVLADKHGDLIFEAEVGWQGVVVGKTIMQKGRGSQTGYTIEARRPVFVDYFPEESRFTTPKIVRDNRIMSALSVPMFIEDEFIGAMLVHSRTRRRFTEAEQYLLSLIANQTTITLKNHERVESTIRNNQTLRTMLDAAEVITSSFGSDQKEVLGKIIEQVVKCVIGNKANKRGFGTIHLYNKETNTLLFKSYYALDININLESRVGTQRFLGKGKTGITGRAALTATPQKINDVSRDVDYWQFHPETRSELDVPLLQDDEVIGVLSLEDEEAGAFDDDDLITLRVLAQLATIALQNAQRYDELKETRDMVAAQTSLAWMGMASAVWGHSISGSVINMRNQVTLINDWLRRKIFITKSRKVLEEKLRTIEQLAEEVLDRPILQPLSSDIGVNDFRINTLIEKRTARLWKSEPYKSVALNLELTEDDNTIRCSPEWIRQALDILINNAINVMQGRPERELTISTGAVDGGVRIDVSDTGPGIAPDVLPHLFKDQIKKSPGEKGLGVGLMIAKAIIQAYRGRLEVARTDPRGTTMTIWLPRGGRAG
ncbi:MAG TPA: GAF domain-containing protein [Blastocatellia bacterium]|nr:GAF domain-containing protein [Blastocatellia bacterium]